MKHKILLLLALFTSTSLFASVKPFYGFDSYKTKARGGQNVMIPSNIMSGLNPVYNAPMKIGSKNLASLSCVGSPKVPIVLVQFSNVSFSASGDADIVDYYDKYWNGTGDGHLYKGAGSYGSVSDYFYAQSGGLFTPQFVVVGPVTLSRAYSYYGQNQGTEKDININQFYEEAIAKILELNVDLTQFDNNNDGVIDMLYFIYAGRGENEVAADDPYTIWPKEQLVKSTIHDMDFGSFACCNELTGNKGSGIGVMCHELSHALGFPDFYTDIGDWVDSKGKKRKTSDAQRYKALGNSLATPFWFWLLRRISAQYLGIPTLGSLFDGIGGFPYCWERINGKGSAVWASEIEEFPIAVTKLHFPESENET